MGENITEMKKNGCMSWERIALAVGDVEAPEASRLGAPGLYDRYHSRYW